VYGDRRMQRFVIRVGSRLELAAIIGIEPLIVDEEVVELLRANRCLICNIASTSRTAICLIVVAIPVVEAGAGPEVRLVNILQYVEVVDAATGSDITI